MLKAYDLRVEYKKNPLGMDELSPRFSYKVEGDSKSQSAYRIMVTCECGKTVWDSGFVNSGESVQILYMGGSFKKHTRYDWKVQVKDENGKESAWSDEEAFFETGFLNTKWNAKWISGRKSFGNQLFVQRLAKEFELKSGIKKARLRITALGLYEAYINGKKITENCFTPGWTDYYNRVQYQVYDVKDLLSKGKNNLSSLLADGWYSGVPARHWNEGRPTFGEYPILKAELAVTLDNGEEIMIATDNEWDTFPIEAPIRMSDIFHGEIFDATFDDTSWKLPDYRNKVASNHIGKAVETEDEDIFIIKDDVKIVWQSGADIKRMLELKPVKITKRGSSYIVDFGQNLTGRERFTLKNAPAGTAIFIRHAEMLNPDGSIYTANLRTARATTTYTSSGKETETYEPFFTFYGFRYLDISGWPGELTKDMISAQVIYSDLKESGNFDCSAPLINQLYSNIVWGQRGNFLDVPTDCPQRDERYGWTGDTQVFTNVATYNMYSPEFYTKWIDDLNLSISKGTECFPHIAPNPYRMGNIPCTGWADAGIICPWIMYLKYGDLRLVKKHFKNMLHYLDWQVKHAGGSWIVANACFGDWLNIDSPTPANILSTAYLAGMTALMAKMAHLIGCDEEAIRRENNFREIKEAFGKEFFTADGEITVKTQTAALLALHFDIVPEHAYRKTADFLIHDIKATKNLHLSTGFLGTPLLLKVLTKIGELDLAYALLQQTTYPGWLYPVTQGATTMWERWNSWSDKDGFGDVGMNSFNHYAYGAVGEWFFESICGIVPSDDEKANRAFKHFKLVPQIGNSLEHAAAEYESAYGKIVSKWKKKGNEVTWEFSVPCNSTAEVIFPTSSPDSVEALPGTAKLQTVNGAKIAGPGNYSFKFKV